jgi:MerR family copper efflux transcriptional regulator
VNIRELASQTGTAERQIRYMIAEGFVPAPRGSRAQADYGEDHVAAVRRYLGLRALGLPPAAIKVLGDQQGSVPLPLIDGITLSIDTRLIGQPIDIAAIVERVASLLNKLQPETSHAQDGDTTER